MRRLETSSIDGSVVEVLEVAPALAANEEFEAAIRARVARLSEVQIDGIARVHRVERRGSSLRVISEHVEGLRLPDLLHEAVQGNIPLSQPAALDLSGRIVRIVAALHQVPGMSHGAITPAHVVVTRTGEPWLTDAAFGPALEVLQRNREQLWREFRLALPASATLPRFDQRADVSELGATVLAVALGRSLREGEYPRAINEVVIAATLAARPGETGTSTSALRMWLQEALHLHPRASFSNACDAERSYAEALAPAAALRGGAAAFESAVRRIFGDTPESAEAAELAAAWSQPAIVHPVLEAARPFEHLTEPEHVPTPTVERTRPLSSLVRSVFDSLR